ncbi:hypothetical protein ACIPK5_30450 [Streptomyces sp. NPDC086843]|uniref:hypothetical protein n=1 Tax=Streptomyces sp. NPDC086843 TaxID=3365763 RepID=UPI0037FD599F
MRHARGGGVVVALAAAAMLALSGCGGEEAPAAQESEPSIEELQEDVLNPGDDSLLEDEEEYEEPATTGPEGEINAKADAEGWIYDDIYGSAAEYVQDMCNSLPDQAKNWSPAQWLAEGGYMTDDGEAILKFGVPKLCPKWSKTIKAAASGNYERWISGGDYEVKASPAPYDPESESGVQEISPGTYVAKGEFSDCYWERTSQSGDIIENQFVTQARKLTVTLQAGELFTNDCGTFRPVG